MSASEPGGAEIPALVSRARRGDSGALDDLARRFAAPLLGYVRARTGLARDDAGDIAQQVWMDVLADIGVPAGQGGFDPVRGGFLQYVLGRFARFRVRQWASARSAGREVQTLDAGGGVQLPDPREKCPMDAAVIREGLGVRAAASAELFRLVFHCGGYPHQQLAFAFSKLIFGRESARAVEGSADLVHERCGPLELSVLLEDFWRAYREELTEAGERLVEELARCLDPVRVRLRLPLGELLAGDASSLRLCDAKLLSRPAGDTRLGDYYATHGRGHQGAISDWCYKVEKRVRAVLEHVSPPCPRCKLRGLPPCVEVRSGTISSSCTSSGTEGPRRHSSTTPDGLEKPRGPAH